MAIPYFGRAWKLTVTPQDGSPAWSVPASGSDQDNLKVTFDMERTRTTAWWYADIAIYNSIPSMFKVLQKGDGVTFEAGYDNPGMGVIFSGSLFQPIWERANETDYRLTLHCLLGLIEDETGYVSVSIAAGQTQGDAVRAVAKAAGILCDPINLDPALDGARNRYPKGQAYSGTARYFFDQVAVDNQMDCWIGIDGVNIRGLASTSSVPDLVYAPPYTPGNGTAARDGVTKCTLIGTPQQTERGVDFRVMLDSSADLGKLVQLTGALVNQLLFIKGQLPPLPLLQQGSYVIAGIRHSGDSRGNDWYTDITAVISNWEELLAELSPL